MKNRREVLPVLGTITGDFSVGCKLFLSISSTCIHKSFTDISNRSVRKPSWGIVFVSAAPEMELHSTQVRERSVDPLSVFGFLEELNSGNNNDHGDDGKDQQILPDDPVGQRGAIMENPCQ